MDESCVRGGGRGRCLLDRALAAWPGVAKGFCELLCEWRAWCCSAERRNGEEGGGAGGGEERKMIEPRREVDRQRGAMRIRGSERHTEGQRERVVVGSSSATMTALQS